MKHFLWIVVLFVFSGCDSPASGVSEEITRQFKSSGRTFVNLANVLPTVWEKVCILGPYATSKHAYDMLGFSWPVEMESTISTNDKNALLLFVTKQEIVEFVEHPRSNGDFANLSRQCFARDQAIFHHLTNPKKGWPGLFPKE
jgi:hypothetical protein